MRKPTFIDLFSGCGGFSLGLKRAGFRCLGAIDNDPAAVATYKKNFSRTPNVLQKDLTVFPPRRLAQLLRHQPHVDVIVGGPPCQGFSKVRKVDGSNHGRRPIADPRRSLYKEFLRYVRYFRPRVFVMENVPGIKSAAGGKFFTRVQAEARKLGYRVHWEDICAWHFGVPQKRIRHLIIGTRSELPVFSSQQFMAQTHGDFPRQEINGIQRGDNLNSRSAGASGRRRRKKPVTLWEAIGDLPPLQAGTGKNESEYDVERHAAHLARYGGRYLKNVIEAPRANKKLNNHVARPHSERDLRDFARLREGEHSAQAIARGERMEFPYDRDQFKDRYTRQHRNRLCSTILAHLGKDGLMFIHPTQNRSLTPREAARVQSFPDWFKFPSARTQAYQLIGNAVPPLVGEAIGRAVRRYIAYTNRLTRPARRRPLIPRNAEQAIARVTLLMKAADDLWLDLVSRAEFREAWFALGFIHSHLHPDAAVENGKSKTSIRNGLRLPRRSPRGLLTPVFARSGWPVSLIPIAEEARRRLMMHDLSVEEYYCSKARVAGARWKKRMNGSHARRQHA